MLLSAVMERPLVSVQTKQEYVQAIYDRYRGARRAEKQRILDEFCAVTQATPEACHPPAQWPHAGGAAAAAGAHRAVWAGDHRRVADDLGSGRLSLVRPAQGAAAAVAAVGPPAAAPAPGGGAAVAAHQPPADRSPAGARSGGSSASGCTGGPSPARCSSTTSPSGRIAGTWPSPASRRSTSSPTAAAWATASSCTRST